MPANSFSVKPLDINTVAGDICVVLPGVWQPFVDDDDAFIAPSTDLWIFKSNLTFQFLYSGEFEVVVKHYLLMTDNPSPVNPVDSEGSTYTLASDVRVVDDGRNWRARASYNSGTGGWSLYEWMLVDQHGTSIGPWKLLADMTPEEFPHVWVGVFPTDPPGTAEDPWVPK